MSEWKQLNNPPVVVALFQLKFNQEESGLDKFLKLDHRIRNKYEFRHDNIHVGIDLGKSSFPLGRSNISGTSEAAVESYVYFSGDKKQRLEISTGKITYIDESSYCGWDEFKSSTLIILELLAEVLNEYEITRTSIRFINKFNFDNFDNPQEYFTTLITNSVNNSLPFPLRQYGFRLQMEIPESKTIAVVNQNVNNIEQDTFIYTFDIDVLDGEAGQFNIPWISDRLELLRNHKNSIFFNNLTQKTIELCN